MLNLIINYMWPPQGTNGNVVLQAIPYWFNQYTDKRQELLDKYPLLGRIDHFLYGNSNYITGSPIDNPIIMLSGTPAMKFNSFEELGNLGKFLQKTEAGEKTVDKLSNTRRGIRPRVEKASGPKRVIKIGSSRLIEAQAERAVQSAAEARAAEIISNQRDLEIQLQRKATEQGINTPAWKKKAMMKAIEINPKTSTPPIAGTTTTPYVSGAVEWEGAPLSEWFSLSDKQFGPAATYRQVEKPFKSASEVYNRIGNVPRIIEGEGGAAAAQTAIDMLDEGLRKAATMIRKKGGKIHIKKENRGKFTNYCGGKITEECTQRGKRSSNPTTRRRATFASDLRRWRHSQGGVIMPDWAYYLIHENNED